MSATDPATGSATPRPAEPVAAGDGRITALRWLVGVVDRLRAPDGCPWDRKQTEASMAPQLVEEAYELVEAIEAEGERAVEEELGDVLMNVVLIARIAEEAERYDLGSVAQAVAEKLVRRHPHVFGEQGAGSAEEALARWEAVKREERAGRAEDASALAGVPKALPALQRAGRICDKAIAAGFRWTNVGQAWAKLREELGELEEVLPPEVREEADGAGLSEAARERVAHELGDLFIAGAHLARYLRLDPEQIAREAVRRFEGRFRGMETELGGSLSGRELPELLAAWGRAKRGG